jgi:nucleoside-diphosphate-sugar epimerase
MELGLFGLPKAEIENAVSRVREPLDQIDGQKVVILGGTGFIGKWLTAIILTAIRGGLNTELLVVARKKPHLWFQLSDIPCGTNVSFLEHDLSMTIPNEILDADQLIIAATPTSYVHGNLNDLAISRVAHLIGQKLGSYSHNPSDRLKYVLHLSSGAVYRDSHTQFHKLKETDPILKHTDDTYVVAKIGIENSLRLRQTKQENAMCSNLRLFAFYGPSLPLDAHFAIGNFMQDAIRNRAIRITGNPGTIRSYLHVSDLCRAIIRFMAKPKNGDFNIGSENALDMASLAANFAQMFGLPDPSIEKNAHLSSLTHYVPSTSKAESHINKLEAVDLNEGLLRWKEWLEQCGSR